SAGRPSRRRRAQSRSSGPRHRDTERTEDTEKVSHGDTETQRSSFAEPTKTRCLCVSVANPLCDLLFLCVVIKSVEDTDKISHRDTETRRSSLTEPEKTLYICLSVANSFVDLPSLFVLL